MRPAIPLLVFILTAPRPGAAVQRIVGRVTQAGAGEPIASVVVHAIRAPNDTTAATSSNQDGRFSIDLPGPGEYMLLLRALGYADSTYAVTIRGSQRLLVELALRLQPEELDTLLVRVEGLPSWQTERPWWEWPFWERRDYYERAGIGRFLTEEDLNQFGEVRTVLQLFLRKRPPALPGAAGPDCSILPSPFTMGRSDVVDGWTMYFNGARMRPPLPRFNPADLIGMEIYQGAAQLPAELAGIAQPCGVIAYWTRR